MGLTKSSTNGESVAAHPPTFVDTYCYCYDATSRSWVPLKLWPAQFSTLTTLKTANLVAILKARQLGLTWLCIAYALWLMIFRPGSTILLFSRRDDEAKELFSRLFGTLQRLPTWTQPTVSTNNDHELSLKNLNSVARSFLTIKHSGRSFTATLVIVDGVDFIPWLPHLLTTVIPTADAGGRQRRHCEGLFLGMTEQHRRIRSECACLQDRLSGRTQEDHWRCRCQEKARDVLAVTVLHFLADVQGVPGGPASLTGNQVGWLKGKVAPPEVVGSFATFAHPEQPC